MDILDRFNQQPFQQLLGIEIIEAANGQAAGRLPLAEKLSSNPDGLIAHGGVAFALADSVGGAAAVSLYDQPTPTIDFRIDYLSPGVADLRATGEVVRDGEETALVEVAITDVEERDVARGRGLYKTGDLGVDAPWATHE